MKTYEELTSQGQVRRIRPMAVALMAHHDQRINRLQLIHHGENTTFRAWSTTKTYLCRIHRPGYQTTESIRSEMMMISHFRQCGVSVPKPIFRNEEAVVSLDAPKMEPRNGVLFEWLPGRFRKTLTTRSASQLGAFLASMHVAAESFQPPEGFFRPTLDAHGLLSEMGGSIDALADEDRELFTEVRRQLDLAAVKLGKEECYGLIHCDLHYGNRIWANDELAAIDFDDAGWSWFVYDLVVALGVHRSQENFDEIFEAFVGGYRDVRPISDVELDAFETFDAVRLVQIALWIQGRSDHPEFVKRYPKYLARIRPKLTRFIETGRT